jgi:hypothetical protein
MWMKKDFNFSAKKNGHVFDFNVGKVADFMIYDLWATKLLRAASARVAKFFSLQHTKTGKIYQMYQITIEYTIWP